VVDERMKLLLEIRLVMNLLYSYLRLVKKNHHDYGCLKKMLYVERTNLLLRLMLNNCDELPKTGAQNDCERKIENSKLRPDFVGCLDSLCVFCVKKSK